MRGEEGEDVEGVEGVEDDERLEGRCDHTGG